MRIKIAILDKDSDYLERLTSTFGVRYARELEIYSFTELETAMKTISSKRIDVFLASDIFEVNVKDIPKRSGFAYFVDDHDTESVKGLPAVCKFQKAELIYKQILGIYSEHSSKVTGVKSAGETASLIIFSSPCGGTGTSTVAAACAISEAAKEKSVLYLNFETFGCADSFFSSEGNLGMTEIIYALKSKKANLPLKLQSCVKQDSSGVFYFSATTLALDNMELKSEEIVELIDTINMSSSFDVIVLDIPFKLTKNDVKLFSKSTAIVMVGDGTEISNLKVKRGIEAMVAIEQGMDEALSIRTHLMYNKFSNKLGTLIDGLEVHMLGGVPRYEHATTEQIISQVVELNLFDEILD